MVLTWQHQLHRLCQEVASTPFSESRTFLRPLLPHMSIALLDTTMSTTFRAFLNPRCNSRPVNLSNCRASQQDTVGTPRCRPRTLTASLDQSNVHAYQKLQFLADTTSSRAERVLFRTHLFTPSMIPLSFSSIASMHMLLVRHAPRPHCTTAPAI
jgi:hypothetical protein